MEYMNIGILAHIDAGKTTVTEQLLAHGGAIRFAGSVDKGTAHTDFMEIERKRGISVRAATANLTYKDIKINIIDTPGHADFAAETDRVIRVLDCAVIVVSAVEGVQARTRILWDMLHALNLPTVFFINKVDRAGADEKRVFEQISDELTLNAIWYDDPTEKLCEGDEELFDMYMNGKEIPSERLKKALAVQCHNAQVFPVMCGCALRDSGVDKLLDILADCMPKAKTYEGEPSGVIFKIEHDKTMGRTAFVRLYSGELHARDGIFNQTAQLDEKITQIREVNGAKARDVGVLKAGDIAAVCGLSSSKVGDILGSGEHIKPQPVSSQPLLRVRVYTETSADYPKLVEVFYELMAENPSLEMIWEKTERQLLISITGTIQTEVLRELVFDRCQIGISFGEPVVIYRETPSSSGYGYVHYTMPKPCWAVLKFLIEPLEAGSGVQYNSIVPDYKIFYRYQAQVENTIMKALEQGPKGWSVTDIKITLVDGEHHTEHTHPLDFIVATPMGIMDGLLQTGTTLLEPMLLFEATVPEEFSGKLIGEIVAMRGTFEAKPSATGTFSASGEVPVSTSLDFPVKIASMTGGRGILSTSFSRFAPCLPENGRTTPYRGVNPADRAKYILSVRSALA